MARKNEKLEVETVDEVVQPVEAPATVRLKNKTRSILMFNLAHASYCGDQKCSCVISSRPEEHYDYRNEERFMKVVDRRICASITLLANEASEFDIRVLNVPDVQRAISRGELLKG